MVTKTQGGFTVIEVMLFLAVTGLLAVGILVGSGVAIGQQRYRDSVNTLKSYIQQQYSEVTSVINNRAITGIVIARVQLRIRVDQVESLAAEVTVLC